MLVSFIDCQVHVQTVSSCTSDKHSITLVQIAQHTTEDRSSAGQEAALGTAPSCKHTRGQEQASEVNACDLCAVAVLLPLRPVQQCSGVWGMYITRPNDCAGDRMVSAAHIVHAWQPHGSA